MKNLPEWLINLGVILRELRLKKGFSSAEAFAFSYELNRSIYQKWETGSNMELKSLSRLCEIHNLRASEILKMAEEKGKKEVVLQ